MYIDLVVLHLLFSHAVRTNGMDFLFTVWVKYIHYYLLPTIQTMQDIWLGIIWIYLILMKVILVLEKYWINVDAASRSTGIAAFTNSTDARRRWLVTHSVWSSILSHLLKSASLCQDEDAVKEQIIGFSVIIMTLTTLSKPYANSFWW